MESLPILKSMKFLDKNGKPKTIPTICSWIKNIEAFQLLCQHMHKSNVNSLLMRHINQDLLEIFWCYSSTRYKTLLVNNMVSSHSVCANCAKDNNCLQLLKFLLKENNVTEESQPPVDFFENHLFIHQH